MIYSCTCVSTLQRKGVTVLSGDLVDVCPNYAYHHVHIACTGLFTMCVFPLESHYYLEVEILVVTEVA